MRHVITDNDLLPRHFFCSSPYLHSPRMLAAPIVARASKNQLPVLIIGSGLGGLTLAHSLAKHRIPYAIYERDNASSQRAQGYRVSIDDGGASGLRSALDDKTFDRFERTCAASHPVGGRLDGPSGTVLQKGILGLLGSGGVRMMVALLSRYLSKRSERWDLRETVPWCESILNPSHRLMSSHLEITIPITTFISRRQTLSSRSSSLAICSTRVTSQQDHVQFHFSFLLDNRPRRHGSFRQWDIRSRLAFGRSRWDQVQSRCSACWEFRYPSGPGSTRHIRQNTLDAQIGTSITFNLEKRHIFRHGSLSPRS